MRARARTPRPSAPSSPIPTIASQGLRRADRATGSGEVMKRILILGGTTEARLLAGRLAGRADLAVTVSLAGRTAEIIDQKVPTRVGGFGGVAGLAAYLIEAEVDALVDATHPFAEIISAHAIEAAKTTGTPLLALRRPAWE